MESLRNFYRVQARQPTDLFYPTGELLPELKYAVNKLSRYC